MLIPPPINEGPALPPPTTPYPQAYPLPSALAPTDQPAPQGSLRCDGVVRPVRATLTLAIKGQWTRWEKGTAVWARKTGRGEYFIRRVRPISKARLSCQNEMAGVPRYLLKIKRPNT